jgi:Ca-activated chloride channel family protein
MRSLILLFSLATAVSAMSLPPPEPPNPILLRGTLNTSCLPHRGGTVFLQLELTAPGPALSDRVRPMNIAVVLDRSGSMADERKLEFAKRAVLSLIDRLSDRDRLAIVTYDDRVETLLPAQRVHDRAYIRSLVEGISPRGSTNLGGGMEEGFRQLDYNRREGAVNRVILISDGLANRGVTDPGALDEIASRYRSRSISLSAIGVGLEFNEDLMLGLSEHGGGNYYFIESPGQFASIFDRELSGISAVVAQNAAIELTLGEGVAMADVIGCPSRQDGSRWIIPVGDLYAGERRDLTVELTVPEGAGRRHVASGRLLAEGGVTGSAFSVDIRYTDLTAELERGRDWGAQGKVDVALSTRGVERALRSLDAGNRDEAVVEIKAAQSLLMASPAAAKSEAAAAVMAPQIEKLKQFEQAAKTDSLGSRLKKSMQYENYRVRRHK